MTASESSRIFEADAGPALVLGRSADAVAWAHALDRAGIPTLRAAGPEDASPLLSTRDAPRLVVDADGGDLGCLSTWTGPDRPSPVFATPRDGEALAQVAAMLPDAAHVIGAKATFVGEACPLLEIASLSATSTATVDALTAVGDRLGARVVVARAPQRFISDRLLAHFYHAADRVLIEGSTPWEVDEALVAFGYACGPYEGQDILGVDRAYASLMREDVPLWRALPAVPILGRMLELGKLGRKTGAGWYRYPGGAGKVDDPIVADLALEEAYFAGLTRQDFTEAEIVERIVLSQINAAARILPDLARPSATTMDAVSIHAVGFPADLGGVLCHADRLGVALVVDALDRLAAGGDAFWAPCPLLRDCAGRGIGLSASM